jgi:hypothetical protein
MFWRDSARPPSPVTLTPPAPEPIGRLNAALPSPPPRLGELLTPTPAAPAAAPPALLLSPPPLPAPPRGLGAFFIAS